MFKIIYSGLWDQLFPQFDKSSLLSFPYILSFQPELFVCDIFSLGYTALMIRRNIANILICLRRVWAVYKHGILLLLLLTF